jgi:hypothetical protein
VLLPWSLPASKSVAGVEPFEQLRLQLAETAASRQSSDAVLASMHQSQRQLQPVLPKRAGFVVNFQFNDSSATKQSSTKF